MCKRVLIVSARSTGATGAPGTAGPDLAGGRVTLPARPLGFETVGATVLGAPFRGCSSRAASKRAAAFGEMMKRCRGRSTGLAGAWAARLALWAVGRIGLLAFLFTISYIRRGLGILVQTFCVFPALTV